MHGSVKVGSVLVVPALPRCGTCRGYSGVRRGAVVGRAYMYILTYSTGKQGNGYYYSTV